MDNDTMQGADDRSEESDIPDTSQVVPPQKTKTFDKITQNVRQLFTDTFLSEEGNISAAQFQQAFDEAFEKLGLIVDPNDFDNEFEGDDLKRHVLALSDARKARKKGHGKRSSDQAGGSRLQQRSGDQNIGSSQSRHKAGNQIKFDSHSKRRIAVRDNRQKQTESSDSDGSDSSDVDEPQLRKTVKVNVDANSLCSVLKTDLDSGRTPGIGSIIDVLTSVNTNLSEEQKVLITRAAKSTTAVHSETTRYLASIKPPQFFGKTARLSSKHANRIERKIRELVFSKKHSYLPRVEDSLKKINESFTTVLDYHPAHTPYVETVFLDNLPRFLAVDFHAKFYAMREDNLSATEIFGRLIRAYSSHKSSIQLEESYTHLLMDTDHVTPAAHVQRLSAAARAYHRSRGLRGDACESNIVNSLLQYLQNYAGSAAKQNIVTQALVATGANDVNSITEQHLLDVIAPNVSELLRHKGFKDRATREQGYRKAACNEINQTLRIGSAYKSEYDLSCQEMEMLNLTEQRAVISNLQLKCNVPAAHYITLNNKGAVVKSTKATVAAVSVPPRGARTTYRGAGAPTTQPTKDGAKAAVCFICNQLYHGPRIPCPEKDKPCHRHGAGKHSNFECFLRICLFSQCKSGKPTRAHTIQECGSYPNSGGRGAAVAGQPARGGPPQRGGRGRGNRLQRQAQQQPLLQPQVGQQMPASGSANISGGQQSNPAGVPNFANVNGILGNTAGDDGGNFSD